MPLLATRYKMPMSGDPQGETFDDPAPVEAEEQTPPNLRDAMSEAPMCGTCSHFAGASCSKFGGYPVKFHEGCDAHSDLAPEETEEGGMEPPMESEVDELPA